MLLMTAFAVSGYIGCLWRRSVPAAVNTVRHKAAVFLYQPVVLQQEPLSHLGTNKDIFPTFTQN